MKASQKKVLTKESINPKLLNMQYAVRGLVPTAAGKIAKEIEEGSQKYDFDEILYCNIGNPQAIGQSPVTYYRNVMSLVDSLNILHDEKVTELFPADVVTKAKEILATVPVGTGGYSESQGVLGLRKIVAKFISERDGHPCDPDDIYLTNGASAGITIMLQAVISGPQSGVLIPIPRYPIYSALITLFGGTQLGYNLNEEKEWGIDLDDLKRGVDEARASGVEPKAMVIINPGNPTGSVLAYEQIADLIKFCKRERLVLFSDEVYQQNVYNLDKKFHSAKKVLRDLGEEYSDFELVSFHSTSKGLAGECGRRGGYMELCGFDSDVHTQVYKMTSCAFMTNLNGQVMMSLTVSPPKPGDESYELYKQETSDIFESLRRKSAMIYEKMNEMDGISCQPCDGAMYAFPKISFPEAAILAAKAENLAVDEFYALSLLKKTGVCCVPGSGFGQEEGTYHLRMTFLPEEAKLEKAMEAFSNHHQSFMKKYSTKVTNGSSQH